MRKALLLLFPLLLAAGEVSASCAGTQDRCAAECNGRLPEDDPARVGCVARCAADRAACEAEAGYEAAKPWLDRRVEEMKRLYEGFKGDGGVPPPPKKTPPPSPGKAPPGKSPPEDLGPTPKPI
ncbi:MAG: hypothetical protein HQL33_07705 [Alphaproteobacteria bacterium]|nr:hypothetical protein [Alphaproteobacteria bacterium]MBF0129863.1 hypothetical protein [Alphaproteobacteria bacterium]